jgi:hypothetical protein
MTLSTTKVKALVRVRLRLRIKWWWKKRRMSPATRALVEVVERGAVEAFINGESGQRAQGHSTHSGPRDAA